MKTDEPKSHWLQRAGRVFGWVVVVLLLGVWPILSHASWRRMESAPHGIPAFFLGLLVAVLGWAVLSGMNAFLSQGWRWLGSRSAGVHLVRSIAAALSVVVLFYSIEWWRGKHRWARVAAEAQRLGVRLDPQSLAPASVPPSEDLGQIPLFAPLRTAARDGDRTTPVGVSIDPTQLGPLEGLVRWGSGMWNANLELPGWMRGETEEWVSKGKGRPVATGDGETNAVELVRERAQALRSSLDGMAGMLDAIREPVRRPHCQFPVDYDLAFIGDTTAERVLLALERLALVRSGTALTLGQKEEASRDLQLALQLAIHVRSQLGLYSQGPQRVLMGRALQTVWEGLRSGAWNEAQIAAIQRLLEQQRAIDAVPRTRRAVAVSLAGFLETLVPANREARQRAFASSESEEVVLAWVRRLYPAGWSLQNQAAVLGAWLPSEASGTASGTGGAGTFHGSIEDVRVAVAHGTSDPLFPIFILPKFAAVWYDATEQPRFAEAMVRLGSTACGLERFRLATGHYPEVLAELVPKYLAAEPGDPMASGSEKLHYRRQGDARCVLYSVGVNGADDGGHLRSGRSDVEGERRMEREPDWVWVVDRVTVP